MSRRDTDMDEELREHVRRLTEQNEAAGMSPAEARRAALLRFGPAEAIRQIAREQWRWSWVEDLVADLRFALRTMRRQRVFTLVAVVTLALGIGANTALYAVMNAVLFRPLPYADSERLVRVYRTSQQTDARNPSSLPAFLDQQRQSKSFAGMAAFAWRSFSLAEPDRAAERVRGMVVTADFFPLLGGAPALGRLLALEEDQPGRNDVVVIAHGLWQSRFGGDPAVVGRRLRLDGETVTVVGVMAASFDYPAVWGPIELWRPAGFPPELRAEDQRARATVHVLGRLERGVSLETAQAEMSAIAARLGEAHAADAGAGFRLGLLRKSGMDEAGQRLSLMMLGLAGFVLLIVCANLASVQVARLSARSAELAIRSALGARRGRVMRQLLTESLLLMLAGGLLGLLVARVCSDLLSTRVVIGDRTGEALALDGRVLLFALATTLATGLAFGAAPAWLLSRQPVGLVLKREGRGATSDRSQHRLRHGLVVTQMALALTLAAGAGLFMRGLHGIIERDPGWVVPGLLAGRLTLPKAKYADADQRRAFLLRLEERVRAIPGVQRHAVAWTLPVYGFASGTFAVEGTAPPPRGQEPLRTLEGVTPGYFAALGIPLVEGRDIAATDGADAPAVVVVNRALAQRFWPGASAIGKRIGSPDGGGWLEIVGVVGDVGFPGSIAAPATRLQAYRPLAQEPRDAATVFLRGAAPPEAMAASLRRAVAELDPDLPLYDLRTVSDSVDLALTNFAVMGWVLLGFAVLGLLLAALGIYGLFAGFVAQRTAEIGVRLALGAGVGEVLWMVLGRGLRLALLGTLLGLGGAAAIARLFAATAAELPAQDPLAIGVIAALLLAVALLACWLPARRAARVHPMVALRHE